MVWCRLDVYIYDYLLKRNLQTTAKAFMAEGKVAADPVGECVPRCRVSVSTLFCGPVGFGGLSVVRYGQEFAV